MLFYSSWTTHVESCRTIKRKQLAGATLPVTVFDSDAVVPPTPISVAESSATVASCPGNLTQFRGAACCQYLQSRGRAPVTSLTGVSIDLNASEESKRRTQGNSAPNRTRTRYANTGFQVVRFRTGKFGNGHQQALSDDIDRKS